MISVSLGRTGGNAVVAVVAVSTYGVVEVVVGSVVEEVVVVIEVVATAVVVEVVVASAAGEVEGDADGLVVTPGASVPETGGAPLTEVSPSTRTADAVTVLTERSAETAQEPQAAVPVITSTKNTAKGRLFARLTLWLRQRPSPLPRKGQVMARS